MNRQRTRLHPFLHAASNLEKHLEVLFTCSSIRHRQALVLNALRAIGASSQRYLAEHFGVSAGTMSSMISRLEALGYVQRSSAPSDRRIEIISNTAVGLAALESAEKYWSDGDDMIGSILGPEDSEKFFALVDKLSKGLGGGPPKPEKATRKQG